MRFSVCISALYPHLPAEEAIARVRACGADAYEFWHWQGIDRDKVRAAQIKHGVSLTGMCMPAAPRMDLDADTGFVKGLCDTIDLCRALSCPGIIVQAGEDVPGMSRQAQHEGLLAGLKHARPMRKRRRSRCSWSPSTPASTTRAIFWNMPRRPLIWCRKREATACGCCTIFITSTSPRA